MKKQLLYLIAFAIVAGQVCAQAASTSTSGAVTTAIRKYKVGNYTGCLQDTQSIVRRDPSNGIAYYYMALSYVQAGKKDEAIKAYEKVISIKPNPTLYTYANMGKVCLESPEKCKLSEEDANIDKAVNGPFDAGLTQKVKNEVDQKKLDALKNQINSGTDINNYDLRNYTDYSKQRSETKTDDKIAKEAQPTNDEIVAALKVLTKAGVNPYAQTNPYAQIMGAQNPEMAQLSSLMGNNNNQSNNNAMLNMIPYMLAQGKNGADNGANSYSPQIMQAMMMNSMLPDFNFDTSKDR